MNPIVKTLLLVGEKVAVGAAGPAGALVDTAVRDIVAHKGSVDENVVTAASAAIEAIEHVKGVDIADEATFKAGCVLLDQGFRMVQASLKQSPASDT